MIKELNVLISGVGGQGVILMSELLGNSAVKDGLRVRGSEVLGMAVRGGSVFSSIRMGSDVYGPLPPLGKCDILVALEPSEALRNITFLSKSSVVILNTAMVVPFTVSLGQSKYPPLEAMVEKLGKTSSKIIGLDATQLAREAGNLLTTNIVMMGALFGTEQLPIKIETVKESIEERFPAKVVPVNFKAFDLGYQACQEALQ
ncbi:MAG: indolepyruvate ferredoxin oxidoreductase subunit beta [Deltaproteobacteria bacterium]|nr:indolepyruvate ferredoxin oxidoreductase subunit beta [Deltaproteobacteria bacterium]